MKVLLTQITSPCICKKRLEKRFVSTFKLEMGRSDWSSIRTQAIKLYSKSRKILNRFAHSVSYDLLEEAETAITSNVAQMSEDGDI
jgi:hypothetical protein